jgi:secreted trypsin-like serine protease
MLRLASLTVSFALLVVGASSARAGSSASPIVGGTAVPFGAWPDVVAIFGETGELCTGTLIAADLVLTAGHCIEMRPREVVIGSIDLARPDGDVRGVKWARAYPDWLERYDIGIVMLEHPVDAPERAIAQRCTARGALAAGLPLQVVGFGLTTKSGTGDNTRLHQATVLVVDPTCTSDPACVRAVAPGGEFVAGGHGADACFGDSGGPAYIMTAHGPALLGVVSRGLATFDAPCGGGGIYVRADRVVAWIESVSDRKLDRVPCDLPADAPGAVEPGGCNAAFGSVHSVLAIGYGLLVALALRRARWRSGA